MGTAAIASAPRAGGTPAPKSVGAVTFSEVLATVTMSASYATGGDTLPVPGGFGSLYAVEIINDTDGTRWFVWDGSAATPKIKGYTATATEVTATTNLSAITLYIRYIFTV